MEIQQPALRLADRQPFALLPEVPACCLVGFGHSNLNHGFPPPECNFSKSQNEEYEPENRGAGPFGARTPVFGESFNFRDLLNLSRMFSVAPPSIYPGAKLSDVPLKIEPANSMTNIHEHMPPLLIRHGPLDTIMPVQQSMIFEEKLEKYVNQDRFEFDIIEGAGHGDPLFETDENMNRMFTFLDKHLN